MTTFLRLMADSDKEMSLLTTCEALRANTTNARIYQVETASFRAVPGAPFAYWVGESILELFKRFPAFESEGRRACFGLSTKDDFSFLRLSWEITERVGWPPFVKGGSFSRYYSDPHLLLDWRNDGYRLKAFADHRTRQIFGVSSWSRWINNWNEYFRPGLTWPRRTNGLSFRVMPRGCIFADKGPSAFVTEDNPEDLLTLCSLVNSHAFGYLVSVQLARTELAQSFEVGLIQQTPMPNLTVEKKSLLGQLARRAWSLKRTLDTIEETSHAFHLPAALRASTDDYDPTTIETELADIQAEIDDIAFGLYGFSDADRSTALVPSGSTDEDASNEAEDTDDSEDDEVAEAIDQTDGLLSWAAGVAFGRFDWRLATGERAAPPEPEPFDPLPAKSPGMLPDDAEPFHAHSGILVDNQGHLHDLARQIEEVLARVEAPVPADVRRWLQSDFFPLHLKQYSKSRRKAPIYWPISTSSGSYTLWLYYPCLTDQTLFTAVNDFIEPKLKQVGQDVAALRTKGSARSRDDGKNFEALQALDLELIELRDTLLAIAQTYRPNHDDGVQITAAPLWQLFRHRPWQKVLKDTWAKLEKGDYDWAHLAMSYWPGRVLGKCHQDRSLAIAHDVEDIFWHEAEVPIKRGKKATGETKRAWQPMPLSEDELNALIQTKIKEIRA